MPDQPPRVFALRSPLQQIHDYLHAHVAYYGTWPATVEMSAADKRVFLRELEELKMHLFPANPPPSQDHLEIMGAMVIAAPSASEAVHA